MANCLQFVRVRWRLMTLVVLAVINILSLTPLPQLPVPGSDKTHHLLAYAVLMFPAFFVGYKMRVALFFAFLAWSGAIEILQPFVNRHGELLDLFANLIGLLIGGLLGWCCRRFFSES